MNIKVCKKCGYELFPLDTRCERCGTYVNKEDAVEVPSISKVAAQNTIKPKQNNINSTKSKSASNIIDAKEKLYSKKSMANNTAYDNGMKISTPIDVTPKWLVGKLIIGIVSIVLFMVISLQSCVAGLGNAILSNGEVSGTFGFLCALNFLIAGIVGICIRNKGKGGHITVCVFYYLILFFAACGSGSYSDLKIWGVLGFIFGTVFLFACLFSPKGFIIGGVSAGLFFVACIAIMSVNPGKGKDVSVPSDMADMIVEPDIQGVEDKDLSNQEETLIQEIAEVVADESTEPEEIMPESIVPEIQETTLLENSGVIIKAVEMVDEDIWGQGIKMYIENNSERNVHVSIEALIVNDYMISDLFSTIVSPNKKTYETLHLSSSELEAAGIDNIGKIELYFRLYDDTWEDIYKSECITIETSEYANMDVTPNDAGKEILNQDGIRVVAKYVDENSFWGKSILLYIENNSEKNASIHVDDMSINGFMVDGLFSATVYAGKKQIDDITLMSSDLDSNGITSVDDVELVFRVSDPDTYDNIFTSDVVSFSTH